MKNFPSKELTDRMYEARLSEKEIETLCRKGELLSSWGMCEDSSTGDRKKQMERNIHNKFLSMLSTLMRTMASEKTKTTYKIIPGNLDKLFIRELYSRFPINPIYQTQIYNQLVLEFKQSLFEKGEGMTGKWGRVDSTLDGIIIKIEKLRPR